MKRLAVFLLLWIFSTLPVKAQINYAQTLPVDSLKRALTQTQRDTNRVMVLLNLCVQLRWVNPDSAMYFGQQALALSKQIQYYRGECLALSEVGFLYREKGDLPRAMNITLKGLHIAEQFHYPLEQAICLQRIANIYNDLKDYTKSIFYNKQSLGIVESIPDEHYIAIQQQNLGAGYLGTNQLDSAKLYLLKAYSSIIRLRLNRLLSAILRNIGQLEERTGHIDQALGYYNQSIKAAIQIKDYRNAAFNYYRLASLYLRINQPDLAILYGRKALAKAQAGPFNSYILNSGELLSAAYKQKQDFRQALSYKELMLKAKEKLFGAGSIQAMQVIVANEEKRRQEVQQAKAAYQTLIRQYALVAGLAFVGVIAFILYRTNRQQQKANRLLHRQKEEISTQREKLEAANIGLERTLAELRSTQQQLIQREKMASLGELTAGIAHEIQNPLNFVNNLSEVSTELVEELEEEIKAGHTQDALDLTGDLRETLEKVNHHGKRADGIVKGMLQHSKTSSGTKEPTDLNALAEEYLRLAYQNQKAKVDSFTADLRLNLDSTLGLVNITPQDMGRVLLNLYNNAFYAVQEKQKLTHNGRGTNAYKPQIEVTTHRENGRVELQVKDNGTGIPEEIVNKIFQPFFTTKPTGQGTGLGLSLSYDIVTKGHGGEMRVDTQTGEFTEFVIALPA